jgi:hypothetical protein
MNELGRQTVPLGQSAGERHAVSAQRFVVIPWHEHLSTPATHT